MVTVTVKLPPTLASRLATEARQKRVSKSALIRDSIEKRYKKSKSSRRPTFGELVGHLAGSINCLPRDLSTNKKYMEGFGAS